MELRAKYDVAPLVGCLRTTTLLPFESSDYTPPNCDEVRSLIRKHSLTGTDVAKLLGVNPRTVRKWQTCTGPNATDIPYSTWRLLLILVGEVSVTTKSVTCE